MKTISMQSICLMLTCLVAFAAAGLAQAATQPTVSVQSYAKHVGSNTVYTYRVTNHGPERLFSFSIGCNCRNREEPENDEPQLIMYPADFDFNDGTISPSSYTTPINWYATVGRYENIDFISFDFKIVRGSGASLLPGQTETFSITTQTKDTSGIIKLYVSGGRGDEAFFYAKNKHGYLKGHYSYLGDAPTGSARIFRTYSFPMQLIDQTPPILTITPTPATLWPPNGNLIPITTAITVKDDYDPQPEIKLESITSSEVLGAGEIRDAQLGTDDRQFSLAATREGANLAGRVYTLTYSATDASGNKSTASTTVTVPHDQR